MLGIFILLICALFGAPVWAAGPISVQDSAGHAVVLQQPARRVVTLAPHLAELVAAAGAIEALVGVSDFSDYPQAVRSVPGIGGATSLSVEAVVRLKPDLVVAWTSGNPAPKVEQIRRAGIPVFAHEAGQLADIAASLRALGMLTGNPTQAEAVARLFEQRLAALRERYAGRPTVRVFYQIWDPPLLTVGGRHFISDVLRSCGASNVFDTHTLLVPRVSREAVLLADPPLIVASGMEDERPAWLDAWRRHPAMAAVRLGRLDFVPARLLQRPTPRLLEGAERLCERIDAARSGGPVRTARSEAQIFQE